MGIQRSRRTYPQMTNGNSPINPIIGSIGHEDYGGKGVYMNDDGLTKREYFAAMAMQGYLSNPEAMQAFARLSDDIDIKAAQCAVEAADALIEALNAEAK